MIGYHDALRLLPMAECIEGMADVLRSLSAGEAVQPLRTVIEVPGGAGSLYTMPAFVGGTASLAVKMMSVFPGNRARGIETHRGVVVLFGADRGEPLAVIEASALTAVRTAAVSAVATRELARDDAGDLAILGSGVQARTHVRGMAEVRKLGRIRAWSPTRAHLEAFAAEASEWVPVSVEVAGTAEEAVRGAGLICVATSARQPVLRGEWISRGAHINAVGASAASTRELDTEAVVRARVYVDSIEAARVEAGDVLIPQREGATAADHVRGELGALLLGRIAGRESPEEITLFKSVGLAVEDAAAAHWVYTAALREDLGADMDLHMDTSRYGR